MSEASFEPHVSAHMNHALAAIAVCATDLSNPAECVDGRIAARQRTLEDTFDSLQQLRNQVSDLDHEKARAEAFARLGYLSSQLQTGGIDA